MMPKEELQTAVGKIRWFHTIDLGQGILTPGCDDSPYKLTVLGMPEDLSGRSVLDIGAWDGFFSFEAERRGARRVVAADSFCWGGAGWGTKAGFELARAVLQSKVEDYEIDVLDLSPDNVGTFDVVLFLGVLYHMRHPLLSLERVAKVTAPGGMAIVETHVDLLHLERPALAFYPGSELSGDHTNWFGPNAAAVEAMLKDVGFTKIEVHSEVTLPTAGDPEAIIDNRKVFHAWK